MAATAAIAGAEAGNRIKLSVESLSDSALHPALGLAEDDVGDSSLQQQIINMPVKFFVLFKVVVQSGFKSTHSRADISIAAAMEAHTFQTAYADCLLFRELDKEDIAACGSVNKIFSAISYS